MVGDILLVGEDRERLAGVRALLREDGHSIVSLHAVDRWREVERDVLPELIVAPVSSPDPILSVPGKPGRGFPAPLLFVQGESDPFREVRLDERLVDRIESPFGAEEFLGKVDALIRVRRVILWGRPDGSPRRQKEDARTQIRLRRLRRLAGRLAALLSARVPRYGKPSGPYLEVAARVADWTDERDTFEPGHTERVATFSAMIADGLGLPDGEASVLLRAAMLHDIGKVALPVEILKRKGPLDEEQLRLMRTHPERGAAIVRALDRDDEVTQAILFHHERTDGKGYYGRSGATIPRAARVLAVAEAFDAMTTSRVRAPVPPEAALALLREQRGTQFDPQCVDALVDAMRPRPDSIPLAVAQAY